MERQLVFLQGLGGPSCSVLPPSSCPGEQLLLFPNGTDSGKCNHLHLATGLLQWQCGGGGGKNARVSEPKARLRHPGAWVMLTLPPSLTSTSTPVTDAREKLPAPHPAGSCHPASPSSIRAPARSALGPSWCPCCCLLHLPPEIPTFYCVSSSRMGAHPLNTNQGPTAAEHILRVPIFTRRRSRIQIPAYLSLRCEPRKLTLEIPCS